ncbi:MAG TPA: hypothetical protein VGW34_09495 [Allosphingosinicella sp.]|nr:hypothetical protein [Allosphingosinicella sp.]
MTDQPAPDLFAVAPEWPLPEPAPAEAGVPRGPGATAAPAGACNDDEDLCRVCGIDPCACAQLAAEIEADLGREPPPAPALPAPGLDPAEVAALLASPALGRFLAVRVGQLAHGHSEAADRRRPAHDLARKARDRLSDALDDLLGTPNAERRAAALRRVEIVGALLLALWDRLAVESDTFDREESA